MILFWKEKIYQGGFHQKMKSPLNRELPHIVLSAQVGAVHYCVGSAEKPAFSG